MSLGRYATGRVALARDKQSAFTTTAIVSSAGSFAVSGQDALFRVSQLSSAGSYVVTGNAASFATSFSISPGSYIVTGNDSSYVSAARRPLYLRGASYWKGSQ